jgi:hypothetical protein
VCAVETFSLRLSRGEVSNNVEVGHRSSSACASVPAARRGRPASFVYHCMVTP